MTDIYHALLNFDLKRKDDQQLIEYRENCNLGAQAITDALRLIGNLLIEASGSEEYSGEEAKRDILLAGSVLRFLPRISEALAQNSRSASHELSLKGKD